VTLFTVGHGTRTLAELVEVLADAGIGRIVDVRRHPGSRRLPHVGKDQLAATLPASAIAYEWWGEELGGRRSRSPDSRHTAWRNPSFQGYADYMDTAPFRDALHALLASLDQHPPTAVMCSETVWWKCHRRLIADAATLLGTSVVHVLGVGNLSPHVVHPESRSGDDGWPIYDAGQPRLATENPP
jgi:uncharacterized protein (DUF488 family)